MEIGDSYRFQMEGETDYVNTEWWKQFNDPILDHLIHVAIENNQNLQVATARVLEFYSKYKIVFSQLYPQLNAEGSIDHFKLSRDVNVEPPIPGVPKVNTLYAFFFRLSYEIDFWGKIRNATDAAKALYLGEVNARRNVLLTLVSSVASAYITLKQSINQLRISELTYASRLESWEIARLRFEGGLVSQLEVKQAESEALSAEIQIKNFEVLIAQQEDLISVLLGEAPGPINGGLAITELSLPEIIPAGLPADLLTNRPDILQAEEAILAANADVGVARAAFFPSFSLTGLDGQRTTQGSDFFKSSANLFDIAIQTFQPLFTGFRLTNQLSESEAVLMQALHTYQQTILTALQEVSDALIAHKKAREKYRIQVEQVAALERYLTLAQLRYFNGQNDYLTVIDAQTSLFRSELLQANTEGDVYLTLIALYKALGQGWDIEGPTEMSCDCESEPEIDPPQSVIVGPIEKISTTH